ncbi:MAG: PLP-dependent transferase [Actinomycetota bacterium]
MCHPATSTHAGLSAGDLSTMHVTDGLLRVSVGLENADDLLADFTQALAG